MALDTFNTARGAVGDVVFQGGRHGTIARSRVRPVNPQTSYQQNQRSILGAVASEWRGLTESQRLGFTALAAQIGGNLTGFQCYVKVNATRVTCAQAKLEDAPSGPPAFGILTPGVLTLDDAPTMTLAYTSTVAADKIMVFAASPVSQGIKNRNAALRLIEVAAGTTGATLNLHAAYIAKFGEPVAGQTVVFQLAEVTNGFKGIPHQVRGIVAET